ncbi:HNH endonuclease signature motif containing protein [Telmatobacter bradus]|uniref:HNH endonuclease signature motif containing protein n=1 Tax=Telmatobacter bradus TaxID=474953 RepID=UPI003B434164
MRAGHLSRYPLCVDPYKHHAGQPVLATDVDHKIPHRGDMKLFWDKRNWRSLCHECHSYKTAVEDGAFGRRGRGLKSSHP